jgi:hypothetical protein
MKTKTSRGSLPTRFWEFEFEFEFPELQGSLTLSFAGKTLKGATKAALDFQSKNQWCILIKGSGKLSFIQDAK